MPSRSQPADQPTLRYPVLSDEPVELRRPRRKARMIAASFAATIALTGATAYAGTTYAISRAESDLRESRDQFARDLEQRRQERDRQQAEVDKDLCTVVTRLTPDPATDELRRRYGCGPFVPPSSESGPTPGTAGATPPGPGGSPRSSDDTPHVRPLARPIPAPAPLPAPVSPPTLEPVGHQQGGSSGSGPGSDPGGAGGPGGSHGHHRPPQHPRPPSKHQAPPLLIVVRVCLPLLGCLL